MKVARYLSTWFEVGVPKYEGGKCYLLTDETKQHIEQGVAEEVDAPEDFEKALAAAQKAQDKADKATADAEAAQANASAASDVQTLVQAEKAAEVAPSDKPADEAKA